MLNFSIFKDIEVNKLYGTDFMVKQNKLSGYRYINFKSSYLQPTISTFDLENQKILAFTEWKF